MFSRENDPNIFFLAYSVSLHTYSFFKKFCLTFFLLKICLISSFILGVLTVTNKCNVMIKKTDSSIQSLEISSLNITVPFHVWKYCKLMGWRGPLPKKKCIFLLSNYLDSFMHFFQWFYDICLIECHWAMWEIFKKSFRWARFYLKILFQKLPNQ